MLAVGGDTMSSHSNIIQLDLQGEKLPFTTQNLDAIQKYGQKLYEGNLSLIREQIPDNMFVVIEPTTGKLIAGSNPVQLHSFTIEQFPDRLFYIVGFRKNYQQCYANH